MVETKLVPTEITDRPMLSQAQLQELSDSARGYCRRNKRPIANYDIFTGAVAVLGDAVTRSLREQGRVAVLEGEQLAPLIQRGLNIRAGICEQAELARKMADSLAIPEQLVSQAHQEIINFALCPNPEACEALVSLVQQRTSFVAGFAQTGLASLPSEFQNASLELFSNPADQAKLARNMVTSFVFRGSLNPFITGDDLKDFAQQARKGTYFDENQLKFLMETLGILDEDEAQFVKALFAQTTGLFKGPYCLPQEGNAKSADQFYRYFGNLMLLQRPSLEAEQIITNPDQIQAGSPSLWDGASSIRGVLVPTPEMLVQVARQEEARLDQASIARKSLSWTNWQPLDRFNGGVGAWKMFQDESAKKTVDIERLGAELKNEELFLANLQADFSLPLPKRAYDIIYASQAKARDELNKANWHVKTVQDRIQAMALEYRVATSYRYDLNKRYGKVWPDQLPIPQAVILQREESRKSSIKSRIQSRGARLTLIANLLNFDPLYNPVHARIMFNFNRQEAGDWLGQEITRIQTLLDSASLVEDPRRFLRRIKERLTYGLRDLDLPDQRAVMPQTLKDYGSFWREVYRGVYDKTRDNVDYWQEQWPNFIREVLERRISLMQTAQTTLTDRFILEEQLAARPNVGSEANFWSADEARSYIADFISAQRKRDQKVSISEDLRDAKSRLQTAEEHYEGVCRAIFIIRLMNEVKSLKFRLEQVRERDPEARFIERMRELKLVLETGVQ